MTGVDNLPVAPNKGHLAIEAGTAEAFHDGPRANINQLDLA
jgi:hypothetical protein